MEGYFLHGYLRVKRERVQQPYIRKDKRRKIMKQAKLMRLCWLVMLIVYTIAFLAEFIISVVAAVSYPTDPGGMLLTLIWPAQLVGASIIFLFACLLRKSVLDVKELQRKEREEKKE